MASTFGDWTYTYVVRSICTHNLNSILFFIGINSVGAVNVQQIHCGLYFETDLASQRT